jgi:hypothetical protein
MKAITVKAELIRAVQACQAKNDYRYYLNGFLLASNGDIVGTNGNILYKSIYISDAVEAVEVDTIIKIDGKIPLNASSVTFAPIDEFSGHATTDTGKVYPYIVVDGKYPNYERVIPEEIRLNFSNGFGITAELMAAIPDVFGKKAIVDIIHADDKSQVLVKSLKDEHGLLVIMPAKSGYDYLQSNQRELKAA